MEQRYLALELASTIRHDGRGGVADDLAAPAGLAGWLRAQAEPLAGWGVADAPGLVADERLRVEVVAVRRAVRALFARAVRPGPASPDVAGRLLAAGDAVALLNDRAARAPGVPWLDWPEGDEAPRARFTAAEPELCAALARAAVDFLAGPQRARLRACTAPRCVRYFVKGHGRQEWCKPSCGNRARAARHYLRQRAATTG
ncbi:CGNR zinc finger domain-containing protein [Streptomyces mayteni]